MLSPEGINSSRGTMLAGERRLSRKAFTVGLRTEDRGFEELTKRAILVSDSLLMSHGPQAPFNHIGEKTFTRGDTNFDTLQPSPGDTTTTTIHYGIHCPDLAALGNWLIGAEPLLKAGLTWYLPSYTTRREVQYGFERRQSSDRARRVGAVDYIIRGGRVIDSSGSNPVKGRLIRPVLEIDLPFIDGVTLAEFSRITVGEFDSYKGFRRFLRTTFLSMDEALNAVQSQVELAKLSLEIEDQVSAMQAELFAARRRRSMAAIGAAVASTAALLIAVEGSVMERVLTTFGLTTAGTFWGAIKDRAENGPRAIENGKWYYVWVLSQKSGSL